MRFSKKGFLFSREYTRKHNFKMTIYHSENTYVCLNFEILKKISLFKRKLKRQFRDDNLLFWKNIHIHICVYINFETVKKNISLLFSMIMQYNTSWDFYACDIILYYTEKFTGNDYPDGGAICSRDRQQPVPACVCVCARAHEEEKRRSRRSPL